MDPSTNLALRFEEDMPEYTIGSTIKSLGAKDLTTPY